MEEVWAEAHQQHQTLKVNLSFLLIRKDAHFLVVLSFPF